MEDRKRVSAWLEGSQFWQLKEMGRLDIKIVIFLTSTSDKTCELGP